MSNPSPSLIVGAGLAGLVAAHAWPTSVLIDRAPGPLATHRALLRFRSDAVSRLTGIPFRPVLVRKGIWSEGGFRAPDIRLANMYSRKVIGCVLGERSIWNVEPAERFVAPPDFYDQLIDNVNRRIKWGSAASEYKLAPPVISTAPLSETIDLLDNPPSLDFARAAISVLRFGLPLGTDVYQTVYFPDLTTSLFRASITGRTLICEFTRDFAEGQTNDALENVLRAFALATTELQPDGGPARQHFGKIAPIKDDAARKHALFRLSHERGIYSLGRFATWRNILLDDVVKDIDVIKRLLRSASAYDLRAS